jgi:hypothetical protein
MCRRRKRKTSWSLFLLGGGYAWVCKWDLVETNKYPQDSVAIVVTWALYELVRHSAVLRQLRAEISKMQVFLLSYYGFNDRGTYPKKQSRTFRSTEFIAA